MAGVLLSYIYIQKLPGRCQMGQAWCAEMMCEMTGDQQRSHDHHYYCRPPDRTCPSSTRCWDQPRNWRGLWAVFHSFLLTNDNLAVVWGNEYFFYNKLALSPVETLDRWLLMFFLTDMYDSVGLVFKQGLISAVVVYLIHQFFGW